TPPTLQCPPSVVTNTEPEQCSAIAVFEITASDTCSGVTNTSCTPPSGSRFPRGTSTVVCVARDAAGNVANCSFSVIVNDRQRPAITCPANIVTNTIAGQCNARVSFL